jgi:hypothetical protein
VRDLYERAMTFVELVGFYGLTRSEGMVLRYLTDAYKALLHSVPDGAKDEDLRDLVEWLGELVRQVDSSLLEEWERLRHPGGEPDGDRPDRDDAAEEAPPPVTANHRAFSVLVRNAVFRRVELAAHRRYGDLAALDDDPAWNAERWREALAPYFDEHETIGFGPAARSAHLFVVSRQPERWKVRQILDDPAGYHEWAVEATVDLAASDEAGVAVCRIDGVTRL